MAPTFNNCDSVLISKLTYLFHKPRVGDIVMVRSPKDGRMLIKRITNIVKDMFFVRGDNTHASTDSRVFGLLSQDAIIGKVIGKIG